MASLDLRNLLMLIVDQKKLDVDLAMDLGCQIDITDPKPLVRVLNYCFNFLRQLSDQQIKVTLNRLEEAIRISMLVPTDVLEPPTFSSEVDKLLQRYQAFSDPSFEPGKYCQILITFWTEPA